MTAEFGVDPRAAAVDRALADWRQGDCAIGEHWFVLRLDLKHPISEEAQEAARREGDLAEVQVRGLVVVTQTCDIVRCCRERPFVEVCPLVLVDDARLREIERGHRPSYAFVPALLEQRLVADLDRTMTLEKPVISHWSRTRGCTTDAEARAFAQALVRKRARFAFPDDFADFVRKLQQRIADKHDKSTDEGRALRALREIRVQAVPSWDAEAVTLIFWFIRRGDEHDFEGKSWDVLCAEWQKLISSRGRFVHADGVVTTLDQLTAAAYVASDPLDLDHLSARWAGRAAPGPRRAP